MNIVFRKTITQTITEVKMGMYKGISKSNGGNFRDKRANMKKIVNLKKQDLTIAETNICLSKTYQI